MTVYIDFWRKTDISKAIPGVIRIEKTEHEIVLHFKYSTIAFYNSDIRCLNVKD